MRTSWDRPVLRPMAGINLTPFVPVLLALFVVVAVSVPTQAPVKVGMSPATSLYCGPPGESLFVYVQADGHTRVDRRTLQSVEQLVGALTHGAVTANTPVYVTADREARYADVFAAIRKLRDAGYERVLTLPADWSIG